MSRTLHSLLILSVGCAGATGIYFLSESRRVAAHNQHLEQRNAALERRAGDLEAALTETVAERGLLGEELVEAVQVGALLLEESHRQALLAAQLKQRDRRLEGELAQALEQRDEFNRTLDERIAEIRSAQSEQTQRVKDRFGPMPEGVRLALIALNRCLAEDGHPEVRFLWAREIDGRTIRDVEMIEHDRRTLSTAVYLADRVTLHFDRERGQMTARMFDGHRLGAGARESFPEEGHPVAFGDLQGPMWESRVGHLMEVEGEYPLPEEVAQQPRLSPDVRDLWIDRFKQLLENAGTEVTYRVEEIGGLAQASFRDVLLLGYRDGKTLRIAIEASQLTVVVDRQTGTVELVLEDGVLRKSGGETRIGGQGYRILLPELTRTRAIDTMMGMVVHR